jgi:hypothetical protein
VALSLVQHREVVEVGRNAGMLRSQYLIDRKRALVERLRLGITALILIQHREVVETGSDAWMLRIEQFLPDAQCFCERGSCKRIIAGVMCRRAQAVQVCRPHKQFPCGHQIGRLLKILGRGGVS